MHESNGVGLNLQDHLMFRPVYKVKNLKSLNRKVESLFGRFMMGLEYIFNQSGPVTMGASQVCGFVKSDPTRACLLYTSPSPRDRQKSRMPSSA